MCQCSFLSTVCMVYELTPECMQYGRMRAYRSALHAHRWIKQERTWGGVGWAPALVQMQSRRTKAEIYTYFPCLGVIYTYNVYFVVFSQQFSPKHKKKTAFCPGSQTPTILGWPTRPTQPFHLFMPSHGVSPRHPVGLLPFHASRPRHGRG